MPQDVTVIRNVDVYQRLVVVGTDMLMGPPLGPDLRFLNIVQQLLDYAMRYGFIVFHKGTL